MKLFIAIVAFFSISAGLSAQNSMDKWPALKDLHTTMSQTFHPAETGNLDPIKARSEELYNKSAALLKSDIPADLRSKEILASAEKLKIKTQDLDKLVKSKAPDTEILKAITEAHDYFHEIVGLCVGEKK